GWAYFTPRELWETTAAVLRDATAQVEQPGRIAGIGMASVGESGVLIDAQGNELYDAIAWYDVRSEPQGEQVEQVLGAERVHAITGLAPQAIFGICKLLWIQQQEPERFGRAVRYLHVADYISWKLSGEAATDFSLASRTLALDLHGLCWSEEILKGMGLPTEIFAPLRRGGELLGRVLPEAAAATGLPEGAAVAVGGHDHLCGALAIGAAKPGALLDSVGTAEAVLLTIERPLAGARVAAEGYEQGVHVAPGYYGMGAYRTAGVCIDWFRTTCAGGADYATLTAEAAEAPLGSLGVRFMPHMRLPHSPSNDPRSRGLFMGLSTDVTRGMMFRAILEGLAFETRNVLEPLLRYAGVARPT
ncbi:MAG: FGGY-family carbohydrate kinase, partial [Caldilineaceae bacterium]